MKIMISDMSKHQVFPREYLVFFKVARPLGGPSAQKCVFGCNTAPFAILAPQNALLGPKCGPGAPRSKPYINTTFWGGFWRPKGGKTDFGAKMGKKSAQNENSGQKVVLGRKSEKSSQK